MRKSVGDVRIHSLDNTGLSVGREEGSSVVDGDQTPKGLR